MAETNALRILTMVTIFSLSYCEKVDKKSAIVARHHTDKCADYGAVSKKCHMWKDLGFCFKHRNEMQYVCSKTCKFCDPSVTHWTYTVTPDENAETKTNIAYAKLSPTLEVMGKKKALYLSSKDIAGMLQTISDKPSPTPQELAVIQGRIQKATPTATPKRANKTLAQIPQEKPLANVGGKVQLPPVEFIEDKDDKSSEKDGKNNKEDQQNDSEKAQEKLTVTGNKEIDSKLLNLMSTLARVNNENKPKEKENETKTQDTENKPKEKEKEVKSQEKDNKPEDGQNTQDNKEKPSQPGIPQNLQIAIPNLLKLLEKINGKSVSKSDSKVNKTIKQQSNTANEVKPQSGNKDQPVNDKTKTLLAAMKLVQSIGPLPQSTLNNSNLMEQLRVAAEEASVAMKLLNKTGIPDKEKDKPTTVTDGNMSFNVQLLRDELKNSLIKQPSALEPAPSTEGIKNTADTSVASNQPQLNTFISSLQNAINAQKSQPNVATSITGRGGVAVKQTEGKPTLSEVIPFDIKVDSGEDQASVRSKDSKKEKQESVFESDEQKIMKILNGLDQSDPGKHFNDDNGEREVVTEIRSAYDELGEIINGVEQDESESNGKGDDQEDGEGKKTGKDKSDDGKSKKKKKDKGKKNKDGDDDGEGDDESDGDDGFINDEEESDESPLHDSVRKKKRKSKKRKDHLNKVLLYIKKAEEHLKLIGGKRLKSKKQQPQDVDADTRQKSKTDWKMLATKLARQLGLVLKKMAEKDQKLLAEKNRLQGVLASLAQTQRDSDTAESDDGEEEVDDSNDEDRSKIIHSMATKLLNFSRTVHDAQRYNHLRTPKKKKRILHNLVSRYRNLVGKILTNWMKLKTKGKKKSGIPKQGKSLKSAKRGEIVRHKGNNTTNATHVSVAPKTLKIQPVKTEKNEKRKSVPGKAATKASVVSTKASAVTDGEQDVIEVAN